MSLSSILLSYQLLKKNNIRVTEILIGIFSGYIFFNYIALNGYSNIHWWLSLLILPLYILVRLLAADERIKQWLLIFFLVVVLVQAVWGLLQLYGFAHSHHYLYKITGTFSNPGPFAGFIAVGVPLALAFALDMTLPRWERLLGMTALAAAVIVLPATMSRAAWIAAVVGCLPVLWKKFSVVSCQLSASKIVSSVGGRIAVVSSIVFLMMALLSGAYFLKKDSADGRRVIWYASMEAVKERPIFGAGYGRFAAVYGDAQATYFLEKERPANQIMVADSPEYAFNEYVQIAVELGLVGLLLFLLMIVSCFTHIRTLTAYHCALISFLVFGAFSYPFSVLPLCIVFVFLLALSAPSSKKLPITLPLWVRMIGVVVCLGITAYGAYQILPIRPAYREWPSVRMLYSVNAYHEAAKEYAVLYPRLRHEKHFLFEYGQSLSRTEQYAESNRIFEEYLHYGSDPMVYNCMGNNFKGMSEYAQAESLYIRASQVVPNRHYPLYLLMKLYQETGQSEKAKAKAETLLKKPVKVQSTAIREMHEEAKQLIMNSE